MQSTNTKAYLSMIFVNVLWGLSFIASKHALSNGFEPFTLALARFAIASVILLPILFKRDGLSFPRKDLGRLLLSALLGMTLYFLFEYKGLERTSASTASLIVAAVPAFTLVYNVLFLKKRYPRVCYLGVITSLLGVYLIVRYGSVESGDTLLGNLLVLGAAPCWVAYIEVTAGLMHRHSSLTVTAWQSVLAALTLLPCALTERVDLALVPAMSWAAVLYLAILCSVVAYLLYVQATKTLDPLKIALFININPLAAVLGGMILLGEALSPIQLAGGIVVLVSIFLVNRNSA